MVCWYIGTTIVLKGPGAQPKRLSILFCRVRGPGRCGYRRGHPADPVRGPAWPAGSGREQTRTVQPLIGALGAAQPQVHPEAWVAPGAVLVGRVRLDRGASVWYGSVLRADEDVIEVGPDCNIQDMCCLHVDAGEPAVLTERVSLGHGAIVHGAYIGAGALIGIGAIVLGGAQVGEGSLIAAGAVVRPGARIPAGVLVAGVPGRVVRELTEEDSRGFSQTPENYRRRAAVHRGAQWAGPAAGGG